ncbi:MAG: tellurite methyltransferase [Gammaproteobacteria bacterium]|jgi:tellurite methyltransferase
MSEQDSDKWDRRYADDSHRKRAQPGEFIAEWRAKIPPGRALDVACGLGQKSMYLAEVGFQVDAIDVSAVGLAQAKKTAQNRGLDINWIQHDLDLPYAFDGKYNLILVMWYVDLALIRQLCDHLAPGGFLLCEEHLLSDYAGPELIGPKNAEFRVAPDALSAAVAGFDVAYYDEYVGPSDDHQSPADAIISRARLVVRGGSQ